MNVSGKVSFEIEIEIEGDYSPARDAWGGGRFEPPINPPEPASIEDLTVNTVEGLFTNFKDGKTVWTTVNLFDGIDRKNPEIVKFLDNLATFAAKHCDAEAVLMGEAAEW